MGIFCQYYPVLLCSAILDVAVDPVSNVWLYPESTSFVTGKTVTCKADGYPQASFQWINTSDNDVVAYGPSLTVNETGSYTCLATNEIRGQHYSVTSAEITVHAAIGIYL